MYHTLSSMLTEHEKTFRHLLKDIELSYVHCTKAQRVRVEKWLEKLISTGTSNVEWVKNRNLYTKLLLDNVLAKQLLEPFHTAPPDGPLNLMPSYLKFKMKQNGIGVSIRNITMQLMRKKCWI